MCIACLLTDLNHRGKPTILCIAYLLTDSSMPACPPSELHSVVGVFREAGQEQGRGCQGDRGIGVTGKVLVVQCQGYRVHRDNTYQQRQLLPTSQFLSLWPLHLVTTASFELVWSLYL
ncbi:hypothetical protein F5141DRAFT_1060035 [Pisolithus sp. B1]|nr:hypothetical protein F5141DRAFT_1060035 [Pisolithus sp. B1]